MEAEDVLEVLSALDHLDVWLGDGGWGVDALLGEQTRPHKDLDLITTLDHAPELVRALTRFALAEGHLGTRHDRRAASRRKARSAATPGYELKDSDRRDMAALRRRFGVRLLPEQVVQTM